MMFFQHQRPQMHEIWSRIFWLYCWFKCKRNIELCRLYLKYAIGEEALQLKTGGNEFTQCFVHVREIHQSLVDSPHKGQWRRAFMFSLICGWTNGWVNKRDAGDLRRQSAHYDVTVMDNHKPDNKRSKYGQNSPETIAYPVNINTSRVTFLILQL